DAAYDSWSPKLDTETHRHLAVPDLSPKECCHRMVFAHRVCKEWVGAQARSVLMSVWRTCKPTYATRQALSPSPTCWYYALTANQCDKVDARKKWIRSVFLLSSRVFLSSATSSISVAMRSDS